MKAPRSGPLALGLILFLIIGGNVLTAASATIRVDATKVTRRVTPLMIGVNLEDLNYQVYGGLYSQLIHGESFQENVDSAVLGLSGRKRLMVYVGENEAGQVVLWGVRGRHWTHNAAREALGIPEKPEPPSANPNNRPVGIPVTLDELPADKRAALVEATSPDHSVSRQWRGWTAGSARASFGFERKAPFIGHQSQILSFREGTGEVGIENSGLNRWGINLIAGKPYDGLLRIKTEQPATLWVSLRDSSGKKLAERSLKINPGADYQRVPFALTPSGSDEKGQFAVSLRSPGSVTIGYVFLQPGPWGRYKDLPLRKDLVQALLDQGVKAIRYNGSMLSRAVDGQLYHWKEMIGPRDLRKPYTGNFNPYASNGFGIFDFLNFAEATGVLPIPGVRIDESADDMAEFVEYVNGPATSTWGRRRAADGHPKPYGLKHLEIGNEELMDDHYCERFEAIARAVWSKDPSMILLVSHNLGQDAKEWELGAGGQMSERLKNAIRVIRFGQQQHGVIWWDEHYRGELAEYENGGPPPTISNIALLRRAADQLVPGSNLQVAPLEENGPNHDMRRALVHARNFNTFLRFGDYLPVVAVANALEAYQQDLVWNQGRTVFTSSKAIPQPPYYVDQTLARNWMPKVVETKVEGTLDAQALISESGKVLVLQVVNDKGEPVESSLTFTGFDPGRKQVSVTELSGSEDGVNTPEEPLAICPVVKKVSTATQYKFPPRSVTLLRFE
ncbi:MAG: alpha-L-arabinofuranosidase C-terminal domain-containing protein [Bryobacteraceae bacterium]